MLYRFKKKYKFVCLHCQKEKESVEPFKKLCTTCEKWGKPGIGQTSLLDFANKTN